MLAFPLTYFQRHSLLILETIVVTFVPWDQYYATGGRCVEDKYTVSAVETTDIQISTPMIVAELRVPLL